MLEDYIYEYVRRYIENEIDYILAKEDCSTLDKYDINDLYMLQNMSEDRKMEIAEQIVHDLKIEEKIPELVHSELYERSEK